MHSFTGKTILILLMISFALGGGVIIFNSRYTMKNNVISNSTYYPSVRIDMYEKGDPFQKTLGEKQEKLEPTTVNLKANTGFQESKPPENTGNATVISLDVADVSEPPSQAFSRKRSERKPRPKEDSTVIVFDEEETKESVEEPNVSERESGDTEVFHFDDGTGEVELENETSPKPRN